MMNTLPFCMITGIAAADGTVAYGPITKPLTLSTSMSLV